MAELTGLFSLSDFTESANVLNANLNEGAEIVDKCPSMNPEVPVGDGKKDVSIPVPGGDKEEPTASEHKEVSVPNAPKVLLDDNTYNQALVQLKKSFTEGVQLLDLITNAQVITESEEDRFNKFMEAKQDDAFYEYCTTVLYEEVQKSDKADIKAVVSKIADEVEKYCDNAGKEFYKPNITARAIVGLLTGIDLAPAIQQIWTTRQFQVIGNVVCEDGQIQDLVKEINEKFKDDLGDYKVIQYKMIDSFLDIFRKKFGWKNQKEVYMLLVDKKLPEELKKFTDAVKEAEKAKEEAEEKKEGKTE